MDCKRQIKWHAKRCLSCARKEQFKDPRNVPAWQGGISFRLYDINFNRKLKKEVRIQDNYKCQLCGKKQNKELLCIHHIDYDKQNCKKDNLISLHRRCNSRVNGNGDYWYAYFKEKQNA